MDTSDSTQDKQVRRLEKEITAMSTSDGAGVKLLRSLGRDAGLSASATGPEGWTMPVCEIDLRPARMAGPSAVIDLFVIMGGVDMRVPEDWTVSCEAVPIMGGVEDRTRPPAGEPKGRLILRGFIMMGGVEVKN